MSERNDVARDGQEFDRSALSADEQEAVNKAVLRIFQRFDGPVLSFEGGMHRTRRGRGDIAQNVLAVVVGYIEGEVAKMSGSCCDRCDAVRLSLMHLQGMGESALEVMRTFGGQEA